MADHPTTTNRALGARPRAAFVPSTFVFSRKFEELSLFVQSTGPGQPVWRAGRIDGEAEISFDHTGDWWVSDLWIKADNGRCGPEARGKAINLDPRDQLWLMIIDSLESGYRDQIEESIDAEFAAAGFRLCAA
jgi:hypothetical protein